MRILTAIFSFALFGFIARVWGPDGLGEYSTMFTYFIFLMQFPLLGLHIILARDIAAHPEDIGRYIASSCLLSFCTAVFLAIIIVVVGWWAYEESMHWPFFVLALTCFPTAIIVSIESALIGREKMTIISKVNIIESIVRSLLSAALVIMGAPLIALVIVLLLSRFISLWLYTVEIKQIMALGRGLIDLILLKQLVKQVPLFFGILLFSASIGKLDLIFLSFVGEGMHDVGIYSAAFKIYEMGVMVPGMISVVLFPIFARLYIHNRKNFTLQFSMITRLVSGIGLPCTILVCALAADIIPIIFGDQYEESIFLFQLLSGAIFCTALDQLLSLALISAKQEKLELRVLASTFVVYVACLLFLIPLYGSLGAAIATLIALVMKVLVRYYYARSIVGVTLFSLKIPSIIISGVAMSLVVFLLSSNVIVSICLGFAAYVLVLLLLKGVTKSDLQQLHAVFAKDEPNTGS
jgi:O-antigen/teichoic acid export membrane protein